MEKIGDKIKGLRKTKSSSEMPSIEQGKLPPQAVDVEEAVLGAIMLENDTDDALRILRPDAFYVEQNKLIFAAIQTLVKEKKPIDILTITHQLRKTGELELVGGAYYITRLTNRVASSANLEFHCRIILQKFLMRELIRNSGIVYNEAFDDTTDVFDLLSKAERSISDISLIAVSGSAYSHSADVVKEAMTEYLERERKVAAGLSAGVNTGFISMNNLTAGWQDKDLIIIAARPSVGKTALMLHHAKEAAKSGVPSVINSLEMTKVKLMDRLILSECKGVSADNFRQGKMTFDEKKEFSRASAIISKLPIIINDESRTTRELLYLGKALKKKGQCELMLTDYLQLLRSENVVVKNGNREQEISAISRESKGIAQELGIPHIMLSQLSRSVEYRSKHDKRPQLSDLRESGAIEQDADMVIFIYRDAYYDTAQQTYEKNTLGTPTNIGEEIVAKHRNGSLGTVRFHYSSDMTNFTEYTGADDFAGVGRIGEPREVTSSVVGSGDDDKPF